MPIEDFLRSFKLVNNHIMRTRRLKHENSKYRKFLEESGLNADDVINNKIGLSSLLQLDDITDDSENMIALQKISNALKIEQRQRKLIEAELYILRQDYHKALDKSDSAAAHKNQTQL